MARKRDIISLTEGFTAVCLVYNHVLGCAIPVSRQVCVLATAYHKIAFTLESIEEYAKRRGPLTANLTRWPDRRVMVMIIFGLQGSPKRSDSLQYPG